MYTYKSSKGDLGGILHVPSGFWSLAWAKQTYGDSYKSTRLPYPVRQYQKGFKNQEKGVWVLTTNDEGNEERTLIKIDDFEKWVKAGLYTGPSYIHITHPHVCFNRRNVCVFFFNFQQ